MSHTRPHSECLTYEKFDFSVHDGLPVSVKIMRLAVGHPPGWCAQNPCWDPTVVAGP